MRREIRELILDRLILLGNVCGNLNFSDFVKKVFPDVKDMGSTDRRFNSAEADIYQHMDMNDDWTVEYLFMTYLDLLEIEDDKFLYFLEQYVNPVIRRQKWDVENEELVPIEQIECVELINSFIVSEGYRLEVSEKVGGEAIYKIVEISGVKGEVKNIIFAARYKPEICFRDALNNDILITKNAEHCLIYDRAISQSGLDWNTLVEWYGEKFEVRDNPQRELARRLVESMDSEPEKMLMHAYANVVNKCGKTIPALIPQVYLYYDPLTLKQRGWKLFEHQKMDFLMLFSQANRIVIEIDGKQHYAEGNVASPKLYANMVEANREMTLFGYEVYRFGGQEFVGVREEIICKLELFFCRLLEKYGIVI